MIELIIITVLLNSVGQIVWRLGARNGFSLKSIFSPLIFVGLLIYACSALLWIIVLKHFEVSYAVPFFSLGYVITAFLGWLFLKEKLSLKVILSILIIVVGVILVGVSK